MTVRAGLTTFVHFSNILSYNNHFNTNNERKALFLVFNLCIFKIFVLSSTIFCIGGIMVIMLTLSQ